MSDATCSVDGCDSAPYSRDLCRRHYRESLRQRTTPGRQRRRRPIAERFWEKVERTDACWLWVGAIKDTGYGTIYVPDRGRVRVHRLAYELLVGPIPDGLVIDHKCHVRHCVNPAHLQAVTKQKNEENRGKVLARSGRRGVYTDKKKPGRYFVSVQVRGRAHYGGFYHSIDEAEAAAIALRNELMTNNLLDRQASESLSSLAS